MNASKIEMEVLKKLSMRVVERVRLAVARHQMEEVTLENVIGQSVIDMAINQGNSAVIESIAIDLIGWILTRRNQAQECGSVN